MANYSRGMDTQKTILDSALELFSQNGYDATSVAEICSKAEVSKGAFYHHFPSKQDLFLVLLSTWLEGVDSLFQGAVESTTDIPEALDNMASLSGEIFNAIEGGFPMLLEFWTQARRQPVIWQQAVAPYRQSLNFFAQVIEEGVSQGAFDPALDPETSARILMAVAMGLLLQATFDPNGADWQEVTRSGIQMILSGLRRLT